MNNRSGMTRVLKKISLYTGFAVLVISIYFSYDGFDQSVSGANNGYTTLAMLIGLTLAIVVSVVQFIFGTAYSELNWTLRFAGIAAYIYSIYTNYLGIKHILGADDFMAISSALFMDIYPEPAIAWALGEALTGDFLGNLGKAVFGEGNQTPRHTEARTENRPVNKPVHTNLRPVQMRGVSSSNQPKAKLASPLFNEGYTNRFKPEGGFKAKPNGGFRPVNYDEHE